MRMKKRMKTKMKIMIMKEATTKDSLVSKMKRRMSSTRMIIMRDRSAGKTMNL
jgi:hypothetical protein